MQALLDIAAKEFQAMGLEINTYKTKVLISYSFSYRCGFSPEGYKRIFDKSLPTFDERMEDTMTCPICGKC